MVDSNSLEPATSAKDSCGRWCATAQLEDGSFVAVPIRCRSWECPDCAKSNKRRLLRRLQHTSPNLFATLTTSERTAATPEEAFARANAAVPLLFKRWKRRFPGLRFEYFLVWERTKRGWPHAHILLAAPTVAKRWLSRQWLELTGCYVVDLQKVGSQEHAARYLAKYLAKDPAVPAGHRRWRRSAGFFQTATEPAPFRLPRLSAWVLQPRPIAAQALVWLRQGFALDLQNRDMPRCFVAPDIWARQIDSGTYSQLVKACPAWALPSDDAALYS